MDLIAFFLTFFLQTASPDQVADCVVEAGGNVACPTLVGGNGGTTPPDDPPEGDKGEGDEDDTH